MSVVDTSAGFRFSHRLGGGTPTVQLLTIKDTETLTAGDLVNMEAGEIDLGATNDTDFVGVVKETKAGTDSVTQYEVITDRDAVYAVYDPNARVIDATLDIAGTTGAMTVASSSSVDLHIVANSAADEPTLVRIAPGEHWLDA